MLAARFYGASDIRLEQIPDPIPGPGEALIEVRAAGICGSDLHRYRGHDPWGGLVAGPRTFGHELSGVVAALGPRSNGVTVGQRVAVEPMQLVGCGTCRVCRRGNSHLCPDRGPGRRRTAGFAEKDVAEVDHLYPLAPHVSLESAAMTEVYACAIHAMHRAPARSGTTALILGSGPLALALGQVLHLSGARTMIAGRRQEALEFARRVGAADVVMDLSGPEFMTKLSATTDGEGADVVFEATGGTATQLPELAIQAVSIGGTVAILGAFVGKLCVPYREANRKEVTLRWSNGYGEWDGCREFQTALDWISDGRVDAESLITHRYGLREIGSAFAAASDKLQSGAMKVMVLPGDGAE